jgi:hypothetical protein
MILAQLFEPDDGDAGLFDGGNRGLEAAFSTKARLASTVRILAVDSAETMAAGPAV